MNHRSVITRVFTVAAMVATLASCSSDSDLSDEQIDGTASGEPVPDPTSSNTPEPEPSASDDGVDRPDIQVGDELEMIFESEQVTDTVKEEILADVERQIKSVYEVITTNDVSRSSISFYTEGEALLDEMSLAQGAVDQGITETGVMRYFAMEVSSLEEKTALVSFCRDFTQVSTVDFETGEVVDPADPNALPTHYDYRVERNNEGVWQTTNIGYEQESPQCR